MALRRIKATSEFAEWLRDLKDIKGRARMQARIQRLATGNPGQMRILKFGVKELKVDVGPGYRVYYTERSRSEIVLLCGGDKSSQQKDIQIAYKLTQDIDL